jgi:hypothetical protein
MDENDFDEIDRQAELTLLREFKDVVGTFKYLVETERRLYLANEVDFKRVDASVDFYFEVDLTDVWVWDINRQDRFLKKVKVRTFKDVNIEELEGQTFQLPKDLSVGE